MAKNTQKNQLECNKKARKTYTDKNFKYQTVCFKIEEIEEIKEINTTQIIYKWLRKEGIWHENENSSASR